MWSSPAPDGADKVSPASSAAAAAAAVSAAAEAPQLPPQPRLSKASYPSNVAQYKLCGVVGEGSNGVVYRAWCRPLEKFVAIKVISLDTADFDIRSVGHEVSTMALCDHPNLLGFHRAFVHKEQLWVVMPFAKYGSLADVLRTDHPGGFQDQQFIINILRQALEGLHYLHTVCRKIHRDVKASNLLLTDDGLVKICDFGIVARSGAPSSLRDSVAAAKEARSGGGGHDATKCAVGGSPCWMAPEVIHAFLRQQEEGNDATLPFALPQQQQQQQVPVPQATLQGPPQGQQPHVPYGSGYGSGADQGQPQPPQQYNPYHIDPYAAGSWQGGPTAAGAAGAGGAGGGGYQVTSNGFVPYGSQYPPQHSPVHGLQQQQHPFGQQQQPPQPVVSPVHPLSGTAAATADALADAISGASDVWSFGITVLELLLGKPPYHRHPPAKVFNLTLNSPPPTLKALNLKKHETLDKGFSTFVAYCLDKSPHTRPSVELLLAHPLFRVVTNGVQCGLNRIASPSEARPPLPLTTMGVKITEIKVQKRKKKKKKVAGAAVPPGGASGAETAEDTGLSDFGHARLVSDTDPGAFTTEASDVDYAGRSTSAYGIVGFGPSWDFPAELPLLARPPPQHQQLQQAPQQQQQPQQPPQQQQPPAPQYHNPYPQQASVLPEPAVRGGAPVVNVRVPVPEPHADEDPNDMDEAEDVEPPTPPTSRLSVSAYYQTGDSCASAPVMPSMLSHSFSSALQQTLHGAAEHDAHAARPSVPEHASAATPNGAVGGSSAAADGGDATGVGAAVEGDWAYPTTSRAIADVIGAARARKAGVLPEEDEEEEEEEDEGADGVADADGAADSAAGAEEEDSGVVVEGEPVSGYKVALCPACLEEPTDGRRLACGHCVCLCCLEKSYFFKTEMYSLLKMTSGMSFGKPGDVLLCPQCSHPTRLRKNKRLTQLKDLPRGVLRTHICDHCEANASVVSCQQCDVTLCGDCTEALHSRGRFKNHKVTSLLADDANAADGLWASLPGTDAEVDGDGTSLSPDSLNYDSCTSTASTNVSARRVGTNLSYVEDYRMNDADLAEALKKRHAHLGHAQASLEKASTETAQRVEAVKTSVMDWASSVRATVTTYERELLDTLRARDSTRHSTIAKQEHLIETLREQIGTVLRNLTGTEEGGELSAVQVFRATSLLATPCASDPQQWSLDFKPALLPHLSSAALTAQSSPVAWTVPPGPHMDISARTLVALCAAVLHQAVFGTQCLYNNLRLRPDGIPQEGHWRVRQLLVFNPVGANLALDKTRVAASGSQEGSGPECAVATGGCWASPELAPVSSVWLSYQINRQEVSTVVIRSYPNKEHAPTHITLEGETEPGVWNFICREEVVRAGTACWDCVIHI